MSKIVARNPKVINIITKALNNSQAEYNAAESEWNDGTRADLALEPQSQNISSIIIEFQHRVDDLFLKRVVSYCLEAYERYCKEPILLIVCIETLSDGVYDETTKPCFRLFNLLSKSLDFTVFYFVPGKSQQL
ncbi:hypothetical protein BCV72DRAFT_329034 [Rhizopus microsporus var. microsporus]|nr:hypothetical protein BCV72DRAFT_329034 [Rhizopus microsporus var. microsporus]